MLRIDQLALADHAAPVERGLARIHAVDPLAATKLRDLVQRAARRPELWRVVTLTATTGEVLISVQPQPALLAFLDAVKTGRLQAAWQAGVTLMPDEPPPRFARPGQADEHGRARAGRIEAVRDVAGAQLRAKGMA